MVIKNIREKIKILKKAITISIHSTSKKFDSVRM